MKSRDMLTEDEVHQLLADGAFGENAYIASHDENGICVRDDTTGMSMLFDTLPIPRTNRRRKKK